MLIEPNPFNVTNILKHAKLLNIRQTQFCNKKPIHKFINTRPRCLTATLPQSKLDRD